MESRTNSERVGIPNKGSHDVNTKSIDLMTKQYLHFDPRPSFASVWTPPRVLAFSFSHSLSGLVMYSKNTIISISFASRVYRLAYLRYNHVNISFPQIIIMINPNSM